MGNVSATQVLGPKIDSPEPTEAECGSASTCQLSIEIWEAGTRDLLGARGPASPAHSRKKTNNKQQITTTTTK